MKNQYENGAGVQTEEQTVLVKHLSDIRGKPRVPALIPVVLSAFAAASPRADQHRRVCSTVRLPSVTVEALSLLMVHRKSQYDVMERCHFSWGTLQDNRKL